VRVFLAGIIQGSHQEAAIHGQGWRREVAALLARHAPEVEVVDHFARHPEGIRYDLAGIRATLAEGNAACAGSDAVICWLPEASMGTAIEMFLAREAGRLVIAVTPMAANWVIRAYTDRVFRDLAALEAWLRDGGLTNDLDRGKVAGSVR